MLKYLPGWAVTWSRGFVNYFPRVPQLYCSNNAAQASKGNSQKIVHKNLNPSSGSSINTNSVSLCIPGDGDEVADDAEGADEEEGEGGRAGYGLLGHHL